MMGYLPARRRADEFAELVDGTTPATAAGDMRAFMAIVEQLLAMEQPRPRDDFSTDLRARLMGAAPTALAQAGPDRDRAAVPWAPSDTRTARRRRAFSLLAAVCIVVGSSVGVAAASESALPGDTLYPFKLSIERLQVSTAGSAQARGERYLDNASTRLTEIETLALTRQDDPTTPTLIDKTLEDFTTAADAGSYELVDAYRTENKAMSIIGLRRFADESSGRLDDLLGSLPVALNDDVVAAADDLTSVDAGARQLCATCSSLPALQLTGEMMTLHDETSGLGTTQVRQPAVSGHGSSPTSAPRPPSPASSATVDPVQKTLLEETSGTVSAPTLPSSVTTNASSPTPEPQPSQPSQPTQPTSPVVTSEIPTAPISDGSPETEVPSLPLQSDLVVDVPTVTELGDATTGDPLLP